MQYLCEYVVPVHVVAFRSSMKVEPGCGVLTLFCLAEVCSTAVRKPVGKVKADSQNTMGG